MNVTDALLSRRSCRAFKADPVDKNMILDILTAAIHTPSWGNSQPWEIYVAGGDTLKKIKDGFLRNAENGVPVDIVIPRPKGWPDSFKQRQEDLHSGMALAAGEAVKQFGLLNKNFFYAPAVIYLCMDKSLTTWSVFDLGALSQSIMLAATEHGLSSIAAINLVNYTDILHKELDIPEHLSVIFGIAVGYEDKDHQINNFKSSRIPIEEVAKLNGFY